MLRAFSPSYQEFLSIDLLFLQKFHEQFYIVYKIHLQRNNFYIDAVF